MASTTGTADRFVDAIAESSAAINDRIKSAIERAQRVTTSLVVEFEKSQQDVLEVGRKVLQDPADVVGIYTLGYQKAGAAQDRAFEFARNFIDEAAASLRDTRSTAERIVTANFDASRPGLEAAREFVTKTGDALRPAFMRQEEAAPAPARARKTAAEEAA
jgi:hypothetical protein